MEGIQKIQKMDSHRTRIPKNTMATLKAIQAMDDAIKSLKQQRLALVSTLPVESKKPATKSDRYITNPLTGKKEFY